MKNNTKANVIEMKNVSMRYDDDAGVLDALKNINLQITSGEFVAIMGPSGSGKSTLMNIIGLLDNATSGQYILDSINTQNLSAKKMARLRRDKIGFVFQNFNLLPKLNVSKNVELPMIYAHAKKSIRKKRITEVLREVGLSEKAKNKLNRMSGGQIQRAAIARALVNKPSILLADEPTGNLDSKTGHEIMQLLQKLNKEGVTIVVVTHNPEITKYASKVVVVRDGKLSVGGKK